ncbi:MAG: hypothetical protein U0166_12375 [Acidobacteriota bacterium]
MEEAPITLADLEKKLSAELLKLGRINRDLMRDRIFRDKDRLKKERSDINMLLLLWDAQQREIQEGGGTAALGAHELKELLESQGRRGDLDPRDIDRLRERRREISHMLREIEHVAEDHRELSQERLSELVRERDLRQAKVAEILQDPLYFDHRVRKIWKAVAGGKLEKVGRYLRGLEEQLGQMPAVEQFDALMRLARPDDVELTAADLLGLVARSGCGPFLQAVLSEVGRVQARFPADWRRVVRAALLNVALFRRVDLGVASSRGAFWQAPVFVEDLEWIRVAVENPSTPPEILTLVLGCPPDELARILSRAETEYGTPSALACMTELLRASRDPEVIAKILDIMDGNPIVRHRFYHVARRQQNLPAALARRVLAGCDVSLEEAVEFRKVNPEMKLY